MDPKTLAAICALLGIRSDEDVLKTELKDLVALRDGVRKSVKAGMRETDASLIALAAEGADARNSLSKLFAALGRDEATQQQALDKIANLMKQSAELGEILLFRR